MTRAWLAGVGLAAVSPSLLDHHGSEARHIAGAWWLMFAMAAVVYSIVAGLVIIAIVHHRPARRSDGQPGELVTEGPSGRSIEAGDSGWIWIGGLVVPVMILAVLAFVTVTTTASLRTPDSRAVRIEVNGERWWWDVEYPAAKVRTANEVHVPVGQPVDIVLRSDNVIHSFWVPQLAGKVDVIPGQTNHLRFTAEDPGLYRGQCAEFCGIAHARMAFVVIAETPMQFNRWLSRRGAVTGSPESETAAAGQRVFMRESCAGCHTIAGTPANGVVGPDLSDFGARRSIGAVTVTNTPAHLQAWISNSQKVKPGNLMPPIHLDAADLTAVAAYLESLQ